MEREFGLRREMSPTSGFTLESITGGDSPSTEDMKLAPQLQEILPASLGLKT
jgi:hypothetical protein